MQTTFVPSKGFITLNCGPYLHSNVSTWPRNMYGRIYLLNTVFQLVNVIQELFTYVE